MARLNIERQERLEPVRIDYAVRKIEELGYEILRRDARKIMFAHKGSIITFFPYSGWATGKTIKDGRGLQNLLNQLERQDATLFNVPATIPEKPTETCMSCKYRERWECGGRFIQYCGIRHSNRTDNGLLKIKANNPACAAYEKEE